LAGKINIITFDKTGTLTEDHLDIYGFRPIIFKDKKFVFDEFQQTADEYSNVCYSHYKNKIKGLVKDRINDLKEYFIECLATCHGNTVVKGKMIGDPIDVKMFQACGWQLKENIENKNNYDSLVMAYVRPKKEPDIHDQLAAEQGNEDEVIKTHYELGIVRRFDFSSKLQRMTVIAKDPNQEFFKAFCKGSPEKVKELCLPETVPDNFADILASYTSKGLRVLACATKFIKMDFMQTQEITQDFVEKDMIFLGLIIVQNKLKKATADTIKVLDNAHIKMVMATGDNILTAIAVSKECNLLNSKIPVFSCEIEKDESDEEKNILSWNSIEIKEDVQSQEILNQLNEETTDKVNPGNDSRNFEENFPPSSFRKDKDSAAGSDIGIKEVEVKKKVGRRGSVVVALKEEKTPFNNSDDFAIACTGSTFEMLYKKKKRYLETKDEKYKKLYDAFKIVLRHGVVYARMAPEHKTLLVENFREEDFKVMMCGDGANDCGALRAADVGVSLSPEEASIAAHFTSKIPDISCVVTVLREGKASLVTSIQTFKYMMMYAFIQFFAVTFLLIYVSYLSDAQYLVSDIFIILPLEFFIAQTDSYEYLTYDIPESSLLSFPILSSIIIHVITCFVFQFFGNFLHQQQDWYAFTCESTKDLIFPCSDNTVRIFY
ncbi:MAG: HAD-IC family P-type ATPase, partial [archaeon]|nr:HAD-IC family P-type ATPase [archaeon]